MIIDLRKSEVLKVLSPAFCFSPLDLVMGMKPMKEANLSELGKPINIFSFCQNGHSRQTCR